MFTITLANLKGGTGKTTLAVNLAAGVARLTRPKNLRVLLVDLDAQGNATEWLLGEKPDANVPASAAALLGELPKGAIVPVPDHPGLDLLPGTNALATTNLELGTKRGDHEGLLRTALTTAHPGIVVLDTPPSRSMILLSALAMTNVLLIPVLPGFFSISGLAELLELARGSCPRALHGVVLFATRPGTAATDETRVFLRKQFARENLFRAEIRISSSATMLPAKRKTVWDRGHGDPRGAEDYEALIREIRSRYLTRMK
ncbi:MAG: ParA family protein [Candidatus Latescibacterota bacterium]